MNRSCYGINKVLVVKQLASLLTRSMPIVKPIICPLERTLWTLKLLQLPNNFFIRFYFKFFVFCLAGEKNFKTLFVPLEKAKCQFESVWNSTNLVSYAVWICWILFFYLQNELYSKLCWQPLRYTDHSLPESC